MSEMGVIPVPAGGLHGMSRFRRLAFYGMLVVAVLSLAVPMAPFLIIPVAWPFLSEQLGIHQLHDVGVSAILWLMLAGLIAQFRNPAYQAGGMQQTVLTVLLLIVATSITRPATLLSPLLIPFVLTFGIAALHPARREIIRLRNRPDPVVIAYIALAAVPFLMYARQQLSMDSSHLPVAAHGGHWTTMASLTATIPVLAILSASWPAGWRVPAWSTGLASILFGIASFTLIHRPSSAGLVWSALAIAWGLGFILLIEFREMKSAKNHSKSSELLTVR